MMSQLSGGYGPRIAPSPTGGLFWRWVLATTLGEMLGFFAPVLAGVLLIQAVASLDRPSAALLTFCVLVAAGSLEGIALGYAQWRVLRSVLPRIGWRAWTGATALAAVLAWSLGMLPNAITDGAGLGATFMVLAWVAVAPLLLLSIGVAQWFVLRRHLSRAALWVPANALGWTLGVGATFVGAALINETMPLWMAVSIGVASGIAMGFVVGCITGWTLIRMVRGQLAATIE
ncbi:hypothetical protein HC891_09545 [Candidatus Gracilibacteria bacterium]|nr:hypothetical protein [Candidatus Gracilibacteria bacterium]